MSDEKTGRLLLADGPMMLREFNPRAVLHFMGRKCMTCGQEIMDHWLVPHKDQEMRSAYWCDRLGTLASQGITDCTYDVKDVGMPGVIGQTAPEHSADPKWDE
jgi:hypothetical protein